MRKDLLLRRRQRQKTLQAGSIAGRRWRRPDVVLRVRPVSTKLRLPAVVLWLWSVPGLLVQPRSGLELRGAVRRRLLCWSLSRMHELFRLLDEIVQLTWHLTRLRVHGICTLRGQLMRRRSMIHLRHRQLMLSVVSRCLLRRHRQRHLLTSG